MGTKIWKICVLRAEILAKTKLKMQNFLKIWMVGAYERRIDGKFRERRLAWKKSHDRSTSPFHFPMWVPREYLLASIWITSYYAHILLIAMLYFDRIIQDLKLTKQKYVYIYRPTTAPFVVFCTRFLMLPVLLNLFVFHKTLWNFVLAANLPHYVWSNAIIWRNQNKSELTLCVWREVSRVHTFGPRVRNVNTAYSRDVFKGSEARKS